MTKIHISGKSASKLDNAALTGQLSSAQDDLTAHLTSEPAQPTMSHSVAQPAMPQHPTIEHESDNDSAVSNTEPASRHDSKTAGEKQWQPWKAHWPIKAVEAEGILYGFARGEKIVIFGS